jgi:DNA-binding HxlR family transcriptional regulator
VTSYDNQFETAMRVIGGKWKGYVIYHLIERPKRTGELKRLLPNVTQKMLVQTLRELEADGIITRKAYNQVPPKVEYSLTEIGRRLGPIMIELCNWGGTYLNWSGAEGAE